MSIQSPIVPPTLQTHNDTTDQRTQTIDNTSHPFLAMTWGPSIWLNAPAPPDAYKHLPPQLATTHNPDSLHWWIWIAQHQHTKVFSGKRWTPWAGGKPGWIAGLSLAVRVGGRSGYFLVAGYYQGPEPALSAAPAYGLTYHPAQFTRQSTPEKNTWSLNAHNINIKISVPTTPIPDNTSQPQSAIRRPWGFSARPGGLRAISYSLDWQKLKPHTPTIHHANALEHKNILPQSSTAARAAHDTGQVLVTQPRCLFSTI